MTPPSPHCPQREPCVLYILLKKEYVSNDKNTTQVKFNLEAYTIIIYSIFPLQFMFILDMFHYPGRTSVFDTGIMSLSPSIKQK